MAQFDAESVVVYQAYKPAIGNYAVTHGRFGGPWSFDRMSWIKPNFLWMMYRCGWATKDQQEVVLAVWLARTLFDEILAAAVPSSYWDHLYPERAAWQQAVKESDVRLQWDPDHGPGGEPLERRAIQLGMRGQLLARFARPLRIEDITPLVREQHAVYQRRGDLITPEEHPYPVAADTAVRLGI